MASSNSARVTVTSARSETLARGATDVVTARAIGSLADLVELALPPLGLLGPLAAGKAPQGAAEALKMADTLRQEMPRMLEEHKQIRQAVEKLQRVAREQRHAEGESFAVKLALHAQTEEEVLYPAAILVGDVIRARMPKR